MADQDPSPKTLSFRTLYAQKTIEKFHWAFTGGDDTVPDYKEVSILDFPVAIIGAGVAGLYTAMMLRSLGIPYHIIEASDRVGGRLYTHHFKEGISKPYDYYDVGAMRFPKTPWMKRTFELFDLIRAPKINYTFKAGYTTLYYNGRLFKRNAQGADPTDKDYFGIGRYLPPSAVDEGYEKIVADLLQPWREKIVEDYDKGFKELQETGDRHSMRTYMAEKGRTAAVISWCETMGSSTASYDRAFSEKVLDSLAFNYPKQKEGLEWPPKPNEVDWYCIDGGSSVIAEKMRGWLANGVLPGESTPRPNLPPLVIHFNRRVTAIEVDTWDDMTYVMANGQEEVYSHVISSIPLPALNLVDLERCYLDYPVKAAIRQLQYGPAIKIGIRFKSNWWWDLFKIDGGQSYSDLPLRTVVYPSYGPSQPRSRVLIASYCWTQDAQRMGALMSEQTEPDGKKPRLEELVQMVLRELEIVHGMKNGALDKYYDGIKNVHVFDWYADPLTMGGFAYFGPMQYQELYPQVTKPAGFGRLHFIGEATSAEHAWVVGALNSAWRGVYEILQTWPVTPSRGKPSRQEMLDKFERYWGKNEEWSEHAVKWQIRLGQDGSDKSKGWVTARAEAGDGPTPRGKPGASAGPATKPDGK